MTTSAILMMILVCGFVWGGFLYLLRRAVRSEAGKAEGPEPPTRTAD